MTCKHHYVLPSVGLVIDGVCKHCGHTKLHNNVSPDLDTEWGRERAKKARQRGSISVAKRGDPTYVYGVGRRQDGPV